MTCFDYSILATLLRCGGGSSADQHQALSSNEVILYYDDQATNAGQLLAGFEATQRHDVGAVATLYRMLSTE